MKLERIRIRGRTEVSRETRDGDLQVVTNARSLSKLHGRRFRRTTVLEWLKEGLPKEVMLAKAIARGGELRLSYDKGNRQLWVVTDFVSQRALNRRELELLVESTTGQWSDGIGPEFGDDCLRETGFYVNVFPILDDYDPLSPLVETKTVTR
jgi:hypothetical protein